MTRVDWPCKICSNLDGNQGERSSQYAAESSCRLRFGVHAKWLGSFGKIKLLLYITIQFVLIYYHLLKIRTST